MLLWMGLLATPWLAAHLMKSDLTAAPHNDDWLYARSVQVLSDQGRYQHVTQHGQLAASVVSHVGWGRLFIGDEFEYEDLHLSQAVAGWLVCCCLFAASLRLGVAKAPALLATVSLLIHPLFWGHTFTFMTDITALMYMSFALLCFVLSRNLQSITMILAGSVLSAMALWSRQTHVLIILVPLVVLGFKRDDFSLLQIVSRTLAITVIPVLAWAVFEFGWLVPGDQQRASIISVKQWDSERARQTGIYLYGLALLMGMLVLPLSAWGVRRFWDRRDIAIRVNWVSGTVVLAGLLGVFITTDARTYITQSVGYFLQNAHFGPVLFADLPHPDGSWSYLADVKWMPIVWQTLTVVSIVAVAMVVAISTSRQRVVEQFGVPNEMRPWRLGLFVFMVVEILFMVTMVTNIVDRYWLVLFVPALLWIVTSDGFKLSIPPGRTGATLMWLSIFTLAYLSTTFTHDLLVWNHHRGEQMQQWLAVDGVVARDVDLGADLNGWLRTEEDYNSMQRDGDSTRSWRGFAVKSLAHRPREGWDTVAVRRWYSWATRRWQVLYLLEKH